MATPPLRKTKRAKTRSGTTDPGTKFRVQTVSRGQMAKALSDLGFSQPERAAEAGRFVVIEVAGRKSKGRINKVIRMGSEESVVLPLPDSVRKAEIIAHATEALDGQVNAMHWLQRPNRSLSGKAPLEVLTNGLPDEAEKVDELLYGLEYGMYA
ncbi:MAG: MbcA/ParS/Xre antitoxin family protein [Bryobacteraceae bacterium]